MTSTIPKCQIVLALVILYAFQYHFLHGPVPVHGPGVRDHWSRQYRIFLPDRLGTPFSLNVSTLRVVSLTKSFYHLAPTLWNDLPLAVRETECRNTFKNRLDKHWRGHPMRLDYKAPYDLGMRSPADQEEVIYEIASQA